jgi:hypothetical protein
MRLPLLHFDQILRHFPEGRVLYELIRRSHDGFSLRELADGSCSGFLSGIGEETTRVSNYLMLLYDRFGQNSYVMGPKVQDLFRRTSLEKVTPDMLVPPVTGFYVALPDCPWRIWGGARTRWHQLSGVYVGFTKSSSRKTFVPGTPLEKVRREPTVHFALWGEANEHSESRLDDALLWHSMSLEEWAKDGCDLETFFEKQAVMLVDEHDVEAWKGCDPLDPAHRTRPAAPETAELVEHRYTLTCVLRTVFNLCLYLNSDEPDLEVQDPKDEATRLRKEIGQKKSGGKRKKLERRLANLPKTRIVYVGPLFESLGQDTSRSSSTEAGGTHASPLEHAVRPHWQRYWVGSGDQRREKWTLKGMYVRGTGAPDRTITKIRE